MVSEGSANCIGFKIDTNIIDISNKNKFNRNVVQKFGVVGCLGEEGGRFIAIHL